MSNMQNQEDNIFDMSAKVKKLLFMNPISTFSGSPAVTPPTVTPEPHAVKLPKIDVPMFDGELLHWQTFWEQFTISVDKHSDISNTEKLVYLRYSLKDGSAKNIIESLWWPIQATDSLKAQYDRPQIIHQAHIREIYELPSLRDGSGKELRQFHDTVK